MYTYLLTDTAENAKNSAKQIAERAFDTTVGIVNVILPVLIGAILVVGLFFGIQLAVKYARAEEEEDKKKAKGSLINVVVGCLIAVVFIAVIEIVLNTNMIRNIFTDVKGTSGL